MKPDKETTKPSKKKITSRQAAAIAGIVLLVLLYIVTLAAAIRPMVLDLPFWYYSCPSIGLDLQLDVRKAHRKIRGSQSIQQ